MFVQSCEYTENHWIVRIITVDIIVCEMYLNNNKKEETLDKLEEAWCCWEVMLYLGNGSMLFLKEILCNVASPAVC